MHNTKIYFTHPEYLIRQELSGDRPAISALLDRAFGEDRHEKTTYRFRDEVEHITSLCFVAVNKDHQLVGTLRFWPMLTQAGHKALLLGPLAVDDKMLGVRCGLNLMEVGIKAARELGEELIVLIGDDIYYGKVGFNKVPDSHFTFPGPVEKSRVLALELAPGSLARARGARRPFKA